MIEVATMSPISTSLYRSEMFDYIYREDIITKERLEEILRYKTDFMQAKINEPIISPYIRSEIAASWARSRKYGVCPYVFGQMNARKLDSVSFQRVLTKNQSLIDIVSSIVSTFTGLMLFSGYGLILVDKNGVILLHIDNWTKTASSRQSIIGMVMNERSVGTNAHVLCLNLKRPVQLLGPEHYSLVFKDNIIASAAPIKDEDGEILAVLGLVTPLNTSPPWENNSPGLISYSLALLIALAEATAARLNLEKRCHYLNKVNVQLQATNDALDTAISVAEEGIITIDRTGKLIHINKEGSRLLKIKTKDRTEINIKSFLNKRSSLMDLVLKGENSDVKEALIIGNEEILFVINIRPILCKVTGELITAVLRFKNIDNNKAVIPAKAGIMARYEFEAILGESAEIKEAISLAQQFAGCGENILLTGESGTGKELFAQAIHNASCPQGPFMAINCAAMPKTLIESELFGYVGGSFTGADRSGSPGKIELANGGTLFLDEIGDMPLDLQAVLLRTLEDKQVLRIGGRNYKKVDFRVIAATNINLNKMVREKLFREDLYYRLSVLPINIPPLRERKNDIDLLSRHFIETYCGKQGRKALSLSPAARKAINAYNWPGNVRELKNAMIYAVNSTKGNVIDTVNLPASIYKNKRNLEQLQKGETISLKNLEKIAIENAMSRANNRISLAAEILGIGKSTLYRKLEEYNFSTSNMNFL